MSRKVSYKVVGRHSIPGDKESLVKYYASVNSSGEISTSEMAERMQLESTLTKADIVAVLTSLENVIVDALRKGEIVRLADLGSLSIGITSDGCEIKDKFTASLIKKARVKFRPGKALSSFVKSIEYSRIGEEESTPTNTTPAENAGA